ncbi:MAG: hypothetical protein K2X38_25240 [Gemmataceae bacterium]|nr:hypothetical protein [Gemmataceae bacterium]
MTETGTNAITVLVPDSLMHFVRGQVQAGVSTNETQYVSEVVLQALTRAEINAKLKVALEQEKAGEWTEWKPGELRGEMQEILDRNRHV